MSKNNKINGRNYLMSRLRVGDLFCFSSPKNKTVFSNLIIEVSVFDHATIFKYWSLTYNARMSILCYPKEKTRVFLMSRPSENP